MCHQHPGLVPQQSLGSDDLEKTGLIQSILRLSSNLIKHVLAHMRVHGRQGVIQKVEGPGLDCRIRATLYEK